MQSLDIWNDIADSLSSKFSVIAVDLPGHGESGPLPVPWSMHELACIVYEVLKACDIQKCVMAGHSMGGYVTLAFAEKHPGMLSGMGLFHATASSDSPEKQRERTRSVKILRSKRMYFINELIENSFAPSNRQRFKAEIVALKNIGNKISEQVIIAALLGMRDRKDRVHVLGTINCPVLFVLGKHDTVFSIEKALPLTFLPKNSKVLILEDAGHMGFIESKQETLFTVEKFVEFCFTKQN